MKKKITKKKAPKIDKNVQKIALLQQEIHSARFNNTMTERELRNERTENGRLNDRLSFQRELSDMMSQNNITVVKVLENAKNDMMEIVRWHINSGTTNHPFKPNITQIPPANPCDRPRGMPQF